MKNDRSAKCEKNLNAKCENNSTEYSKCDIFVVKLDDQSDGQLGQFGRPGQVFSRHFGVSGCQHFTG